MELAELFVTRASATPDRGCARDALVTIEEYKPMARLGGQNYCRTTDRISVPGRSFKSDKTI